MTLDFTEPDGIVVSTEEVKKRVTPILELLKK